MPTFEFTGPDGKTYEVAGPEGATPQQAFGMLQQQMGGQKPAPAAPSSGLAPAPPPPSMPNGELNGIPLDAPRPAAPPSTDPTVQQQIGNSGFMNKVGVGVNSQIQSMNQRLSQLTGHEVSDQEVQDVRDKQNAAGVPGMVGGMLPFMAGPGSAVTNLGTELATGAAAKVLPKALQGWKGVAGNAASSAAMDPVVNARKSDESAAEEAAKAALGAGAIGTAGKVLKRAVGGAFRPNADADSLLSRGVTPPLQTATDSRVGQVLGNVSDAVAGVIPGQGNKGNARVERGGLRLAVEEAAVPGKAPPEIPKAGKVDTRRVMADLSQQYDDAYKEVLHQYRIPIDKTFREDGAKLIEKYKGATPKAKQDALDLFGQYFGGSRGRMDAHEFNQKINGGFRSTAAAYGRGTTAEDHQVGAMLSEVADHLGKHRETQLRKQMAAQGHPKDAIDDAISHLNELDHNYGNFTRLEAAAGQSMDSSEFTANMLSNAVKAKSSKTAFARGNAKGQDLPDVLQRMKDTTAGDTFSNWGVRGGIGVGAAAIGQAPALLAGAGLGSAIQSEKGTKFLLGQYGKQKVWSDRLRKYVEDKGANIYQGLK